MRPDPGTLEHWNTGSVVLVSWCDGEGLFAEALHCSLWCGAALRSLRFVNPEAGGKPAARTRQRLRERPSWNADGEKDRGGGGG